MEITFFVGLCILVAVIVCAIMARVVKDKKTDKELEAPDSAKTLKSGSKDDKKDKSDKSKKSGSNKSPAPNVIYEYRGKRTVMNCPSCDGENNINAATCMICGEKLS